MGMETSRIIIEQFNSVSRIIIVEGGGGGL